MHAFLSAPRTWKPRKWLFWIHLYAGLAVGLLALIIGLSGAALVYSPELELEPRWASAPVASPLPLEELSRRVQAEFPGFLVEDIRFNTAGDATQFHLKRSMPGAGRPGGRDPKRPGMDYHLAVDPETGAIRKRADHYAGAWHLLRELHHDLLSGKTGRLDNGIGAAALFLHSLTGIVIWWPGLKLRKRRTTIQRGTSWKRFNWDLHSAGGFWLAAGLAFFAFTGFQYAFPKAVKGALHAVTFSKERPKKPRLETAAAPAAAQPAALSAVLAAAQSAVPGGRVAQLKFPKKAGEPFEVRVKTSLDGHHEGNNKVYVAASGQVLLADRWSDLPLATRAIELLEPLHNARFLAPGWTSVAARLPWIVFGLAPGMLFLTGFLMWWNRVASKRLAAIEWPRASRARQWARAAGIVAALGVALGATRLLAQQGSLSGIVADESGAGIPQARITLRLSPERAARTSAEGRFDFPNIAPGDYPAVVEAPGFSPWNGMLRAGAANQLRLAVAPSVDSITVNAGTLEQERLEDTVVSTAIDRQDIASRNNRRLSDVVARMPGIFLTGPPGGEKDVRVRGLDKEYSRTQIDGMVIPDGGEKRELQLNRIPSSVVESVRLIRNPTAEFESDGLAGRVDVQTRPIPEGFHLDGRFGYGARGTTRNGLTQGQLFAGSRFHRRFGFTAGYNFINDNLPIDRAKLLANRTTEWENEHQSQRSSNFFGDFGVYTDRLGEFHFKPVVLGFVTNMDKLKSATSAAGALTSRTDEGEFKSQQARGLTLRHQFARAWGLVVDTQGGYVQSTEDKDKTALAYKIAAGEPTPDKRTPELETKADKTWNFLSSASMPFRAGVWHELKFGGAVRFRDRFRDKSKFEISPNGATKDATTPKDRYNLTEDYQAVFVQDRFRFTDRFSLMPGVRVERVTVNAGTPTESPVRRVFLDVNPSAHLLYRLRRDISFHAAASRGLARPKFDELSPFETVAAAKLTIGNPGLEPTRAWSYDVGIDYATSRLSLSVNAFRKTIRGVIEEVDTLANQGTLDIYQVQNVGNGWLRGIELEQRLRMPSAAPAWVRALSFWSNQTFLSSRLLAANGVLRPFKEQPGWIANAGLDFNNDERSGTSVSLISNFTARRFDYKTSGDVTGKGGSSNIDMAVYQRIHGNWRLFAELNNLANRDRSEDEMFVNGTANRRVERYGRTALFGIAFGF